MNLTEMLIKMLSSKDISQTTVALRLIGNFSSADSSEYISFIFKHDFLSSLIIGWKEFEGIVDVEREIGWLLANIVSCYDQEMTKSILKCEYLCFKVYQNLLITAN